MKKKIYISLPISGRDLEEAKACAAHNASFFRAKGYEVVNPFDLTEEGDTYAQAMGKDIAALLTCDEIFLSKGWSNSKGCRAEFEVAYVYDIRVHDLSAEE